LRGTYCEIKAFTLPEEGVINERLDFYGEAHLFGTPDWPNFAIGFWYESGPMAKITVTVDGVPFDLTPGMGVVIYVKPRPSPCYSLKRSYSMVLAVEGDYKFSFLAGYYDEAARIFYYDDRVEKTLRVKTLPVPTIPFTWWLVAGGVGAAALIAVVGIVAYQEEKRRQEMMYMLMTRAGVG
jgi:hypothetical protein